MLERFILVSGIICLAPFLTNTVHNQSQKSKEHVPPRILQLLGDRSHTQNIRGLIELSEFKGDWKKAFPYLREHIKSTDLGIRESTEFALSQSGTRLLDQVKPLVESDDYNEFRVGCHMAYAIGQPSSKFLNVVASKILNDKYTERKLSFSISAMQAMSGMGPAASPKIKKVIPCLESTNVNMVKYACEAIGAMGPSGKPATKKLIWVIKNGNTSTRGNAAVALSKIGLQKDVDIVKVLKTRLLAYTTVERERFLYSVARLGPAAKEVLPTVKMLMETPRHNTQVVAAYAYWKISGDSERPLEVLIERSRKVNTGRQAIEVIGRFGPEAAPAVDALLKHVNIDPKEIVRRELAVVALGKIGPKAKKALPSLEYLAKTEPDWLLRKRAIYAIEYIKGGKKSAAGKALEARKKEEL